jgi:2-polyprenyl-3-methyl-5-hydroxy-6-metoxy-1,4-benzoquinol methylase
MPTLIAHLNERVARSPAYRAKSVSEYFRGNALGWWRMLSQNDDYVDQERAIIPWVLGVARWPGRDVGGAGSGDVLELGAGFGRITKCFYPSAHEMTLIDVNRYSLAHLSREFSRASVVDEDITRVKLGEEKYDLIIAIEVLVHVPNVKAMVRKISHALRRNGSFITSITPRDAYKGAGRRLAIDRPIDQKEFEDFMYPAFSTWGFHCSPNGKQLTYWFRKN